MRSARSIVVALGLIACGGAEAEPEDSSVSFTSLMRGSSSVVAPGGAVVARNQSELNAIWAKYFGHIGPKPPPPPAVDFNAHQVVGLFLGTRPNGCYSMSFTRVRRTNERLIVTYREQIYRGICTQSLVNPGQLIAVPQSQLEVEFVPE